MLARAKWAFGALELGFGGDGSIYFYTIDFSSGWSRLACQWKQFHINTSKQMPLDWISLPVNLQLKSSYAVSTRLYIGIKLLQILKDIELSPLRNTHSCTPSSCPSIKKKNNTIPRSKAGSIFHTDSRDIFLDILLW